MNLTGHFWTIAPNLRDRVSPYTAPEASDWSCTVPDPVMNTVRLSGRWSPGSDPRSAVIIVHGLGGSAERHYCRRAAQAVSERGWSSLRLALRGADRLGEDFYHAGLTGDISAAVADPILAQAERIYLLGYSLGGHVVLRYLCEAPDPRVLAGAAICSPLELGAAGAHLDRGVFNPYRSHVLSALFEMYRAVERRRAVPTPYRRVRRVRTIQEWDALTVVPRFGFADVGAYYAEASVAPVLHRLAVRCLFVSGQNDPMIPPRVVEPTLAKAPPLLDIRRVRGGGHVSFPGNQRIGSPGRLGLEHQVLSWCAGN